MKTLQQDIKIIKQHLKNDNEKAIKEYCKCFTKLYVMQIMSGLNGFEVAQIMKIKLF